MFLLISNISSRGSARNYKNSLKTNEKKSLYPRNIVAWDDCNRNRRQIGFMS